MEQPPHPMRLGETDTDYYMLDPLNLRGGDKA
jgi:hypothetical protein